MPTIAVDANVWYSVTLTDAILTLAELGVLNVVTSTEALEEAERNTAHIPGAKSRIDAIRRFLGDNAIEIDHSGWESIEKMEQINRKDRHVYAAAILGEATLVLTFDSGLSNELRTLKFNVRTPNEFLGALAEQLPELADRALQRMALRRRQPLLTVAEVRSRYEHTAPRFFEATRNPG